MTAGTEFAVARKSVRDCYIRFALGVRCGSRLCAFTMQMRRDFFHMSLSRRMQPSHWKAKKTKLTVCTCSTTEDLTVLIDHFSAS